MDRPLKITRFRELEKQYTKGEITYSRLVELINWEAQKWYNTNFKLIKININNPIINNRIVKDKTFALRLLSFALEVDCSDPCSEDEKESMISYSTSLLKYQIETATDIEEIEYLKRCNAQERLEKGLKFLKIK
jgi:hypothetical protein